MEITVPVRLTEEDVVASTCEYYDAYVLATSKKSKTFRIITISFNIFVSFCMIMWGVVSIVFGSGLSIRAAAIFALLFTLNTAGLVYIALIFKLERKINIKRSLSNFRNDYSSQMLHTYVLSAKGLTDESKTENSILHWEEIYHLTEYASCFIIEKSAAKRFVIPRRCFENAQQLRDFRTVVSSNIPDSIWSLKGIPLGFSKPDAKSDESFDDAVPFPDQNDCLFSLTYQIEVKEAAALNLCMRRYSKSFKILVAFLAILFGTTIWATQYNPLGLVVILLLDTYFSFRLFVVFRKSAMKITKTDKTFGREETASFFPDRVVIKGRDGQTEYLWNTIIRIKMPRAGLLIYLHPGLALIFPARIINQMPKKDEFKAFLKSRDLAGRKRK